MKRQGRTKEGQCNNGLSESSDSPRGETYSPPLKSSESSPRKKEGHYKVQGHEPRAPRAGRASEKALARRCVVMKRKRNEHAAGTKHETQTVIAGANTRDRRCNTRDEHTKGGISPQRCRPREYRVLSDSVRRSSVEGEREDNSNENARCC